MSKSDLLAQLEKKLKAAKKEDARALKSHEAEEQKALKAFHDKCRAALKWDWKTAKRRYSVDVSKPDCPRPQAASIERVIKFIKLDSKEKYSIYSEGDIANALNWIPPSQRKQTLCD